MKVPCSVTLPLELVLEYKRLCREYELGFSEYLRAALEEIGPPTLDLSSFVRAKEAGLFSGDYSEWQEKWKNDTSNRTSAASLPHKAY
jgi:hypothetical protein